MLYSLRSEKIGVLEDIVHEYIYINKYDTVACLNIKISYEENKNSYIIQAHKHGTIICTHYFILNINSNIFF